jgi:hypothetical protein
VQSYKLEFLLKLNIPNPLAGTYRGRKDLLRSGRYLPTGAKCHIYLGCTTPIDMIKTVETNFFMNKKIDSTVGIMLIGVVHPKLLLDELAI